MHIHTAIQQLSITQVARSCLHSIRRYEHRTDAVITISVTTIANCRNHHRLNHFGGCDPETMFRKFWHGARSTLSPFPGNKINPVDSAGNDLVGIRIALFVEFLAAFRPPFYL